MSRTFPRHNGSRWSHPAAQACPKEPGGTAVAHQGLELPVMDASVLDELEDELAQSGLARAFARDYVSIWEQRLGRLAAAMENKDRSAALDAAISLKVSSAMVGGLRLALLAETLERAIRAGMVQDRGPLLALVAESGRATVGELRTRYAETGV